MLYCKCLKCELSFTLPEDILEKESDMLPGCPSCKNSEFQICDNEDSDDVTTEGLLDYIDLFGGLFYE